MNREKEIDMIMSAAGKPSDETNIKIHYMTSEEANDPEYLAKARAEGHIVVSYKQERDY